MTYEERVTGVLEEADDPAPDFNWQYSKLRLQRLRGSLNASLKSVATQTSKTSTWRVTQTDELHGYSP